MNGLMMMIILFQNGQCLTEEVRLRSIQYLSIIITTFCIFIAFSCHAIESFYKNETLLVIIYYLFAQSGMTFLYILVLLRYIIHLKIQNIDYPKELLLYIP